MLLLAVGSPGQRKTGWSTATDLRAEEEEDDEEEYCLLKGEARVNPEKEVICFFFLS